MSVKEVFQEDRRLVILRLLAEDRAGSLNERVLQKALATYGHNLNDTELREDLQFLETELALSIEKIADGKLWVAELQRRGELHLERQDIIDGVARPSRR
ncbi:ArsR family transcriptional regulator [Magnetovibrio sp.]|uniref:VpaChn25_0724 family phage protein n=1 Tax=Magnetovibrio sp. TaxID=2024836 RepID=UPI002F9263FA